MINHHTTERKKHTAELAFLPAFAARSINRCNLPAVILGGYTYQQYPAPLTIDGVFELHREFFQGLESIHCAEDRSHHFRQYMCSAFLLGKSEEAGFDPESRIHHQKLDYLRLLRGWMFDADGVEGAVMKRWVESRFGLQTLNHKGLLREHSGPVYEAFHADYVRGLYNSNALESQLDLLFSYCQYELQRQCPEKTHQTLYRAVNHINEHRVDDGSVGSSQLLLNNLNSFSSDRYLAETFGDVILEIAVPVSKLLYFPELLKGVLRGESEYIVLGGVYQATVIR